MCVGLDGVCSIFAQLALIAKENNKKKEKKSVNGCGFVVGVRKMRDKWCACW